jgi:hypothetical protein
MAATYYPFLSLSLIRTAISLTIANAINNDIITNFIYINMLPTSFMKCLSHQECLLEYHTQTLFYERYTEH